MLPVISAGSHQLLLCAVVQYIFRQLTDSSRLFHQLHSDVLK